MTRPMATTFIFFARLFVPYLCTLYILIYFKTVFALICITWATSYKLFLRFWQSRKKDFKNRVAIAQIVIKKDKSLFLSFLNS